MAKKKSSTPPETDFHLVSEFYFTTQTSYAPINLEKIAILIASWKQQHPHLDLATYDYRGGAAAISRHGLFLAETCLEKQYSAKPITLLLDEGIKSAELIPIYLRNAIASNDVALCKRVLAIAQEYDLDANNIKIELFTPLSYAAFRAATDCIKTIIASGVETDYSTKKEVLHPLVALQISYNRDADRVIQSFEALIEGGVKIGDDAVHCEYFNVTTDHMGKRGPEAGRLLINHFVAQGLNLNVSAESEDNAVYPRHYFLTGEKENEKYIRFEHLTPEARTDIDFGIKIPKKVLAVYLYSLSENADRYLPIYRVPLLINSEEGDVIKRNYGKIEHLLATTRAENLACRCFSFGLLDKEMFEHILQAENKQRAKVGDAALSAEQFFNRLPPFVRADEALTAIKQTIDKTHAAASECIVKIRSGASKNTVVLE